MLNATNHVSPSCDVTCGATFWILIQGEMSCVPCFVANAARVPTFLRDQRFRRDDVLKRVTEPFRLPGDDRRGRERSIFQSRCGDI